MIQAKLWLVLILVICSLAVFGQDKAPSRPSPVAITSAKYKDTYVKITYGQPRKRGRIIFGELVPFGEVWRTGANEATEITLTKDIIIQSTLLPAGTYSIFTIPEKDFWTIIVNKEVGLWGAYNYNQKLDVFRLRAPVNNTGDELYESFTIQFDQRNNAANLLFLWEKTKVSIPVQFIEPK